MRITRAQQFPTLEHRRHRHRRRTAVLAEQHHQRTIGGRQFQSFGSMESGLLGPLSPADGSGAGSTAGAGWAQRAVRLTLVQQVAGTYLQLRALDRQLDIARQTVKIRQDSVDLTRTLESGGAVPLSDLRQAEQLLYQATAQIPQLEQDIQQDENGLRVLLGENPGPVAHTDPAALAPPPQDLPVGIPSQLLERRPDIQQAEQQLVAANAQIGVARAQFFPQLSISASGGVGGRQPWRTSSTGPTRPSTGSDRWRSRSSPAASSRAAAAVARSAKADGV